MHIMFSMLILSKSYIILCDLSVNRIQFIFRHPKSVNAANVFLSPFDSMVWYATIGLCLLSGFIVRTTYLLEKQLVDSHGELNEDSHSNSMLMVFGFIFQQSTSPSASESI